MRRERKVTVLDSRPSSCSLYSLARPLRHSLYILMTFHQGFVYIHSITTFGSLTIAGLFIPTFSCGRLRSLGTCTKHRRSCFRIGGEKVVVNPGHVVILVAFWFAQRGVLLALTPVDTRVNSPRRGITSRLCSPKLLKLG